MERLHPAVLKQMRACGIAVEVQDTVRGTWGYPGGAGGLQGGGRGPFTLLTFFILFPFPAQRLRHLQLPIDRRAPRSRRAHPPAGHLQGGLGAARLRHGLSASSLACQARRGCCAPPITAPEGETLREELEGVGRGRGCTAPGTLGGSPRRIHRVEVQSACLVVNARRATCACCQQCSWCKHRAAALPGGVPGLPKALLWGFVFVGSLESPKQLWVTRSACSPSPCGLEQLKQGYGAGHRGDAAAVPGLQSGPGLALLSELAVLISVCH